MPRRIPDYPDAFSGWIVVSSFGSLVSVIATILFGYIIYDIFANQPVLWQPLDTKSNDHTTSKSLKADI